MYLPFPRMGLVALSMAWSWACASSGTPDGGNPADAGPSGARLEISPPSVELAVIDGAIARQAFTVRLHHRDGSREDVSDRAGLSIDTPGLGRFEGAVLSAHGRAAGASTVRASFMGLSATAALTVRVQRTRIVAPAPHQAPALLRDAVETPALAPAIVYPADQTMVPPNLGKLEVHWRDEAGADLFEVTIRAHFVALRLYVAGTPGTGTWTFLLPEEWAVLGQASRGSPVSISLRGMRQAEPGHAGSTAPVTVHVTDQAITGGIYYWAARSRGGAAGIYRHDMARAGERAEPFYTTQETPGKRCVACHVLSRDGNRMAVTYDGGNDSASILDIATRREMLPLDTYHWSFATFEPGGKRLLTTHKGKLTLRDAVTGAVAGQLEGVRYGTHPDFSPTGDAIVFVEARNPVHDWRFRGGSLMTASFDPVSATFGPPVTRVACERNCFYPSWSPDGQWILFNQSTEDAYDDASAELWVVRAEGNAPPIRLDTPNLARNLTNSWARWAPFEQSLGSQGETLFWFTFSSKRDFGVRLAGVKRPQIWMAPFFPERARRGADPSAPAFHLPIQSVDSNNHIAQWTEKVVSVETAP